MADKEKAMEIMNDPAKLEVELKNSLLKWIKIKKVM